MSGISPEARLAALEADYAGLAARFRAQEKLDDQRERLFREMDHKLDSLLEFKAEVTGGKKALMALWVAVGAILGGIITLISKWHISP